MCGKSCTASAAIGSLENCKRQVAVSRLRLLQTANSVALPSLKPQEYANG
jgi:hypothetical protein